MSAHRGRGLLLLHQQLRLLIWWLLTLLGQWVQALHRCTLSIGQKGWVLRRHLTHASRSHHHAEPALQESLLLVDFVVDARQEPLLLLLQAFAQRWSFLAHLPLQGRSLSEQAAQIGGLLRHQSHLLLHEQALAQGGRRLLKQLGDGVRGLGLRVDVEAGLHWLGRHGGWLVRGEVLLVDVGVVGGEGASVSARRCGQHLLHEILEQLLGQLGALVRPKAARPVEEIEQNERLQLRDLFLLILELIGQVSMFLFNQLVLVVHAEALALARRELTVPRVRFLVAFFAARGRAVVPHGPEVAGVIVAVGVVARPVSLSRILLRAQQGSLAIAVLHFALEDVGHVVSEEIVAVAVLVGGDVVALLHFGVRQVVVLNQFLKLDNVDSVGAALLVGRGTVLQRVAAVGVRFAGHGGARAFVSLLLVGSVVTAGWIVSGVVVS